MRLLFDLDTHDYDPDGPVFSRPSARCISIRDGKVAMVHSLLYDYYKFPGGGMEKGESLTDALIRETQEEAGLTVLPGSIREYGYVHRVQRDSNPGYSRFEQNNYYYLCETEPSSVPRQLDDYEAEERFTPEWVSPETAIRVNRSYIGTVKSRLMLEREARVLELLIEEGYFGK